MGKLWKIVFHGIAFSFGIAINGRSFEVRKIDGREKAKRLVHKICRNMHKNAVYIAGDGSLS